MEYLVGVVLALMVSGSATVVGLDRDRAFYPTLLAVIASYYALFAVMGGAVQVLAAESIIIAAFLVVTLVGFKLNLWFVVGALFVHGVFDFFHGHLIANQGVPVWWPGFCLAYDITAALYLAGLLRIRPTLGSNQAVAASALELKVPPVALVLIVAFLMWVAAAAFPGIVLPATIRVTIARALVVVGVGFSLAGVASFRRARTTVNPTQPSASSTLVSTGVYRLTRNPMYLGFLLILLGWAVFLANALAVVGAPVFVLYMNRFQIAPEERALAARFGAEFSAYKARVRRWF
jgi:protein-S-isoprenylcysteine O-methyltransferase Ste14